MQAVYQNTMQAVLSLETLSLLHSKCGAVDEVRSLASLTAFGGAARARRAAAFHAVSARPTTLLRSRKWALAKRPTSEIRTNTLMPCVRAAGHQLMKPDSHALVVKSRPRPRCIVRSSPSLLKGTLRSCEVQQILLTHNDSDARSYAPLRSKAPV